ncbi:hypothetical protein [Agrobacterium sp. OT33]|uniref:hypothetical protein n=1 Tax=Agrobacterium sp. OT33 TaxID=2815338 RepID=UPI001A8DE86C|nr:hypothetical protein [Agrobacterium sp. OT33]MBO0128846.1 hypothetical protein [Agrobacterium sp. OT33]
MAAVFPERRRISSSSAALIGGVPGSDGLAGDTQFIHPVSAGIGDHAPNLAPPPCAEPASASRRQAGGLR